MLNKSRNVVILVTISVLAHLAVSLLHGARTRD